MNQKCQRKREEEASLLANAVDNQPMSTQTISKAPEAAPEAAAPTEAPAAPAAPEAVAPAAPEAAAPAEALAEAKAAPATDVSVPVPEQPKKRVGFFALYSFAALHAFVHHSGYFRCCVRCVLRPLHSYGIQRAHSPFSLCIRSVSLLIHRESSKWSVSLP